MSRRGTAVVLHETQRLSRRLLMDLLLVGLTQYAAGHQLEYPVVEGRQWRFDVAFPAERVAIEFQGGTWTGGRHVRGAGYQRDAWKLCAAAAAGWLVFPITWGMLREDLETVVDYVARALQSRTRHSEG